MSRKLTEQQRRCVDAILHHMKEYLDWRYVMVVRANKNYENIWPDLQWLHLQQLRNTLSNDKAWGPIRFVVGELLCSSMNDKIRDLFSTTNQRSIMNEIVERDDATGSKTADILAIHDFKTLYAAVDPNISKIAMVMQIYIWWDIRDAADLSKFHFRIHRYREIEKNYSDHYKEFYRNAMEREDHPTQEEVLDFECHEAMTTLDDFGSRRVDEPGYKIILARQPREGENADQLIASIAREQVLLQQIQNDQALDGSIRDKIANSLKVPEHDLTKPAMVGYLRKLIEDQKSMLNDALSGKNHGEPFNFKLAQYEHVKRVLGEVTGDRIARLEAARQEQVQKEPSNT